MEIKNGVEMEMEKMKINEMRERLKSRETEMEKMEW